MVQLAEASRAFITVTPVKADASSAALQAPARVAFRDGRCRGWWRPWRAGW
ncbi:hypothetical protein QEG98_41595 [Myxococcus sp. MxC21-1]|uniref:hypothetical protein n=1 Tax=Myxococcus sp. MxC21-1 TaxID=3041439 RepID=UPI002930B6DD|nr:hypothetical protein [Myxococcus sp. MxC21-1]WNZ62228.1 hypothetical protein QEG98_41595 [Myxococcus sp. MxC21-1]